jgi:hypothetical protein
VYIQSVDAHESATNNSTLQQAFPSLELLFSRKEMHPLMFFIAVK